MNVQSPILSVRDLSVTIDTPKGPLSAVRGIGFDVMRGETLCIVGESGCGKSMTSLALMNLLPHKAQRRAATLEFAGSSMADLDDRAMERLRGNRMAMIFQEPMTALNPAWSVGEQLIEGSLRHEPGLTRTAARARAVELLTICGVPDPVGRLAQYPHQLSGGLRQRVMIAMALMTEPDLLIADEPTTALDVTISAQILDLLRDLQTRLNLAIILITHDFDVVRRIGDRIAVMYAGEIVETGTRAQVLDSPRHPYTRALMTCVPDEEAGGETARLGYLPGVVPSLMGTLTGCQFRDRCSLAHAACAGSVPWHGDAHRVLCTLSPDEIAARYEKPLPPAAAAARTVQDTQTAALTVNGVRQTYDVRKGMFGPRKSVQALRGIDLKVMQGEVLGLVGESGSGKSTLARALLGIERPAEGSVLIRGRPVGELARLERARLVQPILQDPYSSLNPRRTVAETIRLPLDIHGIGSSEERDRAVHEMMDLCGLPRRVADNQPSQMSGGQRQRVAIASALILKPEIVICDEPTSALDVSVQAQILNLLKDLRLELGLTYVLISHDLNVIRAMSDRVAVMYFGRIIETGTAEALFETPAHPYAEMLLKASRAGAQDGQTTAPAAEFPDPSNPPQGCAFYARCTRRSDTCAASDPQLVKVGGGHAACWHPAQPA